MADTINKPKLQLRSGASFNDKTLSPSTKLLINHGKPNFTIQRSPKVQQNGEGNPLSPKPQNGLNNGSNSNNNNDSTFKNANGNTNGNVTPNNDIVVTSTKFNGVFRPANLPLSEKQAPQQTSAENEAAKVVLRRVNTPEQQASSKADEDGSLPEFIRKQRRIQERLAKDNILDFESRRSGYFTHVMISPSSPNRTSFIETMSSPAIVPSLEMPPPARKEKAVPELQEPAVLATPIAVVANGDTNGHAAEEEEEEVAKAIEEVNKAVAGEDDDKTPEEEVENVVAAAVKTVDEAVTAAAQTVEETVVAAVESKEDEPAAALEQDVVHAAVAVTTLELLAEEPQPVANEAAQQNGHATNGNDDAVSISHTNGMEGPSVPAADPSGALGVNFEPKTVVSFSKDLGSEPNKYPDTVKTTMEGEPAAALDSDLQEMAKLKFDIKTDAEDVQVTPVLRTE